MQSDITSHINMDVRLFKVCDFGFTFQREMGHMFMFQTHIHPLIWPVPRYHITCNDFKLSNTFFKKQKKNMYENYSRYLLLTVLKKKSFSVGLTAFPQGKKKKEKRARLIGYLIEISN